MDKPQKYNPTIEEYLKENPDTILAERIRLWQKFEAQKAAVLKLFEGTFLYPLVKWWLK